MTIGIFCPTEGDSSLTIRTLRKFIKLFQEKGIKIKIILAGSNGHYSSELDSLNIDYKTMHANPWIFPAYSKSFSASEHTEETLKYTIPIASQFSEWGVDLILSISLLSNSGAIASNLISKPHAWFVNESLKNGGKYKGYFDDEHYQNLIQNSGGLIFDSLGNLFDLIDSAENNSFIFKRLESFTENLKLNELPKVDIILPFYNDENIFECIDKLKKYRTTSLENIIIVLDQGPDINLNNRVRSQYKDDDIVKIIENKVNSGFVHSCNVGMMASINDVVLLNTDTIPGPFWLENLQKAGYSDNKIMTASPLSNSIEDLSIPSIKHNQEIDVEETANILNSYVSQNRIEVFSAHGFCMYIKREAIDKVGLFNEKEFGKGYGEENEFSLRVRKMGYLNILVGNSFVKHLGSRSFTTEAKQELKKKNSALLKERYPYMIPEFLDFLRVNPLAEIDNILKFFTINPKLIDSDFMLLSANLKMTKNISSTIKQLSIDSHSVLLIEGPYSQNSKEKILKHFKNAYFIGPLEFPGKFIQKASSYFIDRNYRFSELEEIANNLDKKAQIIDNLTNEYAIENQDIEMLPNFITRIVSEYSSKKLVTPFYSPTMVKHFVKKNVLKSFKAYIVRKIEHNKYTLSIWIKYNKFKKKVRKFFRKSPLGKRIKRLLGRS